MATQVVCDNCGTTKPDYYRDFNRWIQVTVIYSSFSNKFDPSKVTFDICPKCAGLNNQEETFNRGNKKHLSNIIDLIREIRDKEK